MQVLVGGMVARSTICLCLGGGLPRSMATITGIGHKRIGHNELGHDYNGHNYIGPHPLSHKDFVLVAVFLAT